MQPRKSKRPYSIVVEFENSVTQTVTVKAISREVAESRALKFNPHAKGVKRDA